LGPVVLEIIYRVAAEAAVLRNESWNPQRRMVFTLKQGRLSYIIATGGRGIANE